MIVDKQINRLKKHNTILKQRGILNAALEAGWQDANYGHRQGWKYPLNNPFSFEPIDHFWKNIDSKDKGYKYRPFNGSLSDHWGATWYIPNVAKTIQAIQDNDGLVYIANGAPALLAYRAAGIYNSLAGRAEGRIPDKLLQVLRRYGVTRVLYPVDNDEAGKKTGARWRDALRESGIDFVALEWDTDKLKYDANDLWIDVKFNRAAFIEHLTNCKTLKLDPPKPKKRYTGEYNDNSSLVQKILDVLGVHHFNAAGYARKNISSPFREDNDPSFNINKDTGVGIDFGDGNRAYSPWEIADHLGISYEKPKSKKQELKRIPAPINPIIYEYEALPGGAQSWLDSPYLPTAWLQAMLALSDPRSNVAIIASLLHRAFKLSKLNPHSFTITEVCAVLGKPRGSTTAAIKTLENWGFVRGSATYTYTNNNKGQDPVQNSKGGRPPTVYNIMRNPQLLSLDLLERLEYFSVERHTKNAIAPRLNTMSTEANREDFDAWFKRTEQLIDPLVKHAIKGDMKFWFERLIGKDWKAYMELDLDDIDNNSLRAAILIEHINRNPSGVQLSQLELSRLLGVKSNSCFTAVLSLAGVKSIPQHTWFNPENPRNTDIKTILEDAAKPNMSRRGGVAIGINFKYLKSASESKWTGLLCGDALFEMFNKHQKFIENMAVYVKLPNLYRFKTPQELEEEQKEMEDNTLKKSQETFLSAEKGTKVQIDHKPAKTPKKPKNGRRNIAYSAKPSRDWTSHDRKWLWEQLQVEMFCWLNYELTEDGIIKDANGKQIALLKDPAKIIKFIGDEIERLEIENPFHMPNEYYGVDVLDFSNVAPPF